MHVCEGGHILGFTAWLRQRTISFLKARYAVSVIAVGVALMAVSVYQHFSVCDPAALIYLAAIALSVWYGQKAPEFWRSLCRQFAC